MNRSLMPSIKSRTTMKERDEDLALFLEMRKRDKDKTDLLFLHDSDELDDTSGIWFL